MGSCILNFLFFKIYLKALKRLSFEGILWSGFNQTVSDQGNFILVANHTSWWDGFLCREAALKLRPKTPVYVLMLSSEIKKYPILKKIGGVGIEPGSPSSLLSCLKFLKNKISEDGPITLIIFPQGRIWPTNKQMLHFQEGVDLFAKHLNAPQAIAVGLVPHFSRERKPWFFIKASKVIAYPKESKSLHKLLEKCTAEEIKKITSHLETYGEDAVKQWPPRETQP